MFKSDLEIYADDGNKEIDELWLIPRAERKKYIKKHYFLFVCLDNNNCMFWSSMNRGF